MTYTTTQPASTEHFWEGVELGIGTWAWGDRLFWSYGSSHTEADVDEAFQASLEAGITFFDTAEIYGRGASERMLGQLVQNANSPVLIATKFFPYPWRLRASDLEKALRGSLKRLGLSQVDLYQIHWPFPFRSIEAWMNALAYAVENGLTRAVGVSNYNLDQMRRASDALSQHGIHLASNQVEYSLWNRTPETTGLLDTCRDRNIKLIAYSPLAQGLLTGKYTPEHPPAGVRRWRYRGALEKAQPLIRTLQDIGSAHNRTPAQVAINWVICKGAVPIPGAKNASQARQNAEAASFRLTDEEVARLDRESAKLI